MEKRRQILADKDRKVQGEKWDPAMLRKALMFSYELQYGLVENIRLLPITRMPGFRNDQRLRPFDARRKHSQHRGRRVHIGISGDQQCWDFNRFQACKCHSIPQRLRGGAALPAHMLELYPPSC